MFRIGKGGGAIDLAGSSGTIAPDCRGPYRDLQVVGSQRSRGDLAMIGNSDASVGMINLSHDDVAAPLPVLLVPHLRQRRYHFTPGHAR